MLNHQEINIGDPVVIKTFNCRRSIKKGNVTRINGEWLAVDSRKGIIKMSQVEKSGIVDMQGWNIQQKRDLLNLNGGRFFSLKWVKKDGSIREANCKHLQHDLFALGHKELALESTVASKPEYYTAVDVQKEGWINVDLNTLFYIKINSLTYIDLSHPESKNLI
jgi:hypothetical protein